MRRLLATIGGTDLGDLRLALRLLLQPGRLIQGPVIETYERAFAAEVGAQCAVSFASGRVALYAILRALGVGQGDDVLLSVPTHIVVANAIRYVGARPVFVDCDPATYGMDLDMAERLITPASRVLLVQHTFGIPIDLDHASELARRRGLVLVEDCVHALGARYGGRSVGSVGRAAFFSTEETKTITSTMGGMAVTNDPDLGARMRDIQAEAEWPSRSLTARFVAKLAWRHVLTQPDIHPYTKPLYMFLRRAGFVPGPTSMTEAQGDRPAHYLQRLTNAQAALALRQLRRLEANVAHRNAAAAVYERRLRPAGLRLTDPPPGAIPVYLRYPVWVRDRDATVRAAASRAMLGRWFTSVLEECVRPEDGGYVPGLAPHAEEAARHLINLPTHRRVRLDDIEAITRSVIATEAVV